MSETPPPPPAPSEGLSLASLICGILAFPTCLATSLPAIICGHIGLSRAKKCGSPTGKALAGLILGYISIAAIPVIAAVAGLTAPMVIRQRHKADQVEASNHMKNIAVALMDYETKYGRFPADLRDLETEGMIRDIDELLRAHSTTGAEWLYAPDSSGSAPNHPVLISPPIGDKVVVLHVDMSVSDSPSAHWMAPTDPGWKRIPVPSKTDR